MIYKNAKFGEHTCISVEFGSGDIEVAFGVMDKSKFVCFKNIKKRKVGELISEEFKGNVSEAKPEVVIIFNRVESLDILIDFLIKMRNTID
jgi:hypothetical protein